MVTEKLFILLIYQFNSSASISFDLLDTLCSFEQTDQDEKFEQTIVKRGFSHLKKDLFCSTTIKLH